MAMGQRNSSGTGSHLVERLSNGNSPSEHLPKPRSVVINVATDFSDTPAGRFDVEGPFSGERFRQSLLVPALRDYDEVIVDLNGVEGFGSSFLEEAFGGLVRLHLFSKEDLAQKLKFLTDDPSLEVEIQEYISRAAKVA